MRKVIRKLLVLVLLAAVAGCGGTGGDADGVIRVYAAASLTESFTQLGKQFEKEHPGTTVELNLGPSSGLAQQIESGAPADVFASASPENMVAMVEGGHAEKPKDFAKNTMEIALPPDNPGKVEKLADLANPRLKVALCQVQVPCGKVAAEIFAGAGLTVTPATEETDVKSVLTKVSLGEVDAGVVYVTDIRAAGDDVHSVEIPQEQNASTTYPIATLTDAENTETAEVFVDFVLSKAGAKILRAAGFQKP